MGRYSGILFKLVEEAASDGTGKRSRAIWSKVFHYLEAHSFSDANVKNPTFDSPLPPFTAASESLSAELLEPKGGPRGDSTVLKIATCVAPAMIVAALCHLQPQAASVPDVQGRIPLHLACRRSAKDPDIRVIFEALIASYPKGLVQRDCGGRTPLHYLFAYHAPYRTPEVVDLFCQTLPTSAFIGIKQPHPSEDREGMRYPLPEIPTPSQKDKVPPSAAIMHDAIEGALPLHYAVVKGASKEVLKVLLDAYPESKYLGDRKGRTALSLYFGASLLEDETKHVSGEPIDPNDAPWWDNKLESAIVKLLLSSRVTRTADYTGRYPLHWACCLLGKHYYSSSSPGTCLSLKVIQFLMDYHIEALVVGDLAGKTPLHLLFDSVRGQQHLEWKRLSMNKVIRDTLDLEKGGPSAFSPPKQLVELLLTEAGEDRDDRLAAFVEDNAGRLPLHAALEVATSADIVKLLIKTHPASLLHTTEEQLISPLHAALISPLVAPLQTLETMRLVLEAYVASRHGSYIDGRLALKMEDADGNYPIHYACRNQACLDVLRLFVDKYPKGSIFQNADGDLPLHSLLDVGLFSSREDGNLPVGASLAAFEGWECPREKQFHKKQLEVMQQKVKLLIDPILASRESSTLFKSASSAHGMLPLHIAVAFGAVPYSTLFTMLESYPEAASKTTTEKGHIYSTIDLHEMYGRTCCEHGTANEAHLQNVRELLFSFHPLVDKHRHNSDLLAQCVRLVRSEIGGHGSYHLAEEEKMKTAKSTLVQPIEMSETLTCIDLPELDHGGRPFSRRSGRGTRKAKSIKRIPTSASMKSTNTSVTVSQKTKSIYDDDVGLGLDYVVSEENSDDDFDDDSFSSPESAEEYLSDEYDENESFDDDDNMETLWNPSKTETKQVKTMDEDRTFTQKQQQAEMNQSPQTEEPRTAIDSDQPSFSEVAMRILSFFILYCDQKNPSDNYAQQVESILGEVSRTLVETIVSMPVPSYAKQYLEGGVRLEGLSFRELASSKSREVIKRLFYFLGRFDFCSETGGILLYRNADNNTVLVRATEWIFTTEEYNEEPQVDPGVVEAEIWETGVIPTEKVGYIGSTFRAMRRSVCFLFTKNVDVYHNEVQCRSDMGVTVEGGKFSNTHVIPLITHFNSQGMERSQDRQYRLDTNNDAFSMLHLFGGAGENETSPDESIRLADYPFALVYPYSNYGDLFDYFFRHGVEGPEEIREICFQVGQTLRCMHEKGIVHGNVCMRNIALFPPDMECKAANKYWALSNMGGAFRLADQKHYLGSICYQGTAHFQSSSLPPEMFVKLSNGDLKIYNEYWSAVEQIFNISVDKSVIKPVIDFQTGVSYVLRCHFVPSQDEIDATYRLPPLPYKLLSARESCDLWAFGQLLFMLCSCGRPLFPTNARTGHLLNYREISGWDTQAAENMVYEHVKDPLAQDVLLRLLSPYEQRASLDLKTILKHPFFQQNQSSSVIAQRIVEQRTQSSNMHIRLLRNKVTELSQEEWLRERTVSVDCWDFDFLTRFHLTPTSLAPEIMSRNMNHSSLPCSFILLPYRLSMNKRSKLTPGTKKDVERAEQVGIQILSLSKTCQFVNLMKQVVLKEKSSTRLWSFSDMLQELNLPEHDFDDVISEMTKLAAYYVELFRYDPVHVGVKLVQGKIKQFLSCFEDSKNMWLYLVDEYRGVPVVASAADIFPHMVREDKRWELLKKGLPFMYMCSSYFRGVSGSVVGLVRLIFEAACPHIPPSWQAVAKGLNNSFDRDSIVNDIELLRNASSNMNFSGRSAPIVDDDLEFMLQYLLEIDAGRTFAKLQRVSSGGASLWTTANGVKEIMRASNSYGFREALEKNLQTQQLLQEKEDEIETLKNELEKLRFRREMNLEVPDLESRPESSNQNSSNSNTQSPRKSPTNGNSRKMNHDVTESRLEPPKEDNSQVLHKNVTNEQVLHKNVTNELTAQELSDEVPVHESLQEPQKPENIEQTEQLIGEAAESESRPDPPKQGGSGELGDDRCVIADVPVKEGQGDQEAVCNNSTTETKRGFMECPSDEIMARGKDPQHKNEEEPGASTTIEATGANMIIETTETFHTSVMVNDQEKDDDDLDSEQSESERDYEDATFGDDLDAIVARNTRLLQEINVGSCSREEEIVGTDTPLKTNDSLLQELNLSNGGEKQSQDAPYKEDDSFLPNLSKLSNLQAELEKMRFSLGEDLERASRSENVQSPLQSPR